MARKHFDDYYNKVYKQYTELQVALADMSAEVDAGMMPPERVEQLKQTILPVKNSFESLSYIRYLLDKPARKSKHAQYDRRSHKVLKQCGNHLGDDVIANNGAVISALKSR